MSIFEEIVAQKILHRAEIGLKKYGVGVDRTDLSTLDWMNHLQEELMDGCVYLERIITELELKQPETDNGENDGSE